MGKLKEYGHAAGKGALGAVAKWVVGILLVSGIGTGIALEANDDDDDNSNGAPTTSQEDD